jgi:L-ribulose-5-phosphate 4-epimerase
VLYQRLAGIGGVVHTHSPSAAAWAQAGRAIPCLGTTHADHFRGEVPVTRALTAGEIEGEYEWNTGVVIAELYGERGLDPDEAPGVLVRSHGPFVWGHDAAVAAVHAEAVETVARMASATLAIDPATRPLDARLTARHFDRKHGANAYYGQRTEVRG